MLLGGSTDGARIGKLTTGSENWIACLYRSGRVAFWVFSREAFPRGGNDVCGWSGTLMLHIARKAPLGMAGNKASCVKALNWRIAGRLIEGIREGEIGRLFRGDLAAWRDVTGGVHSVRISEWDSYRFIESQEVYSL